MKASLKLILIGGLLLAGGCKSHDDTEESYLNKFVPDGEPRRMNAIVDTQAAVGAREDGMLYPSDFDGLDLNSLGRAKLASIVDVDSIEPITIHMNMKADAIADRKKSVIAFMQDKGLATSHVKIVDGVNDATLTPAAPGIINYGKTDTAAEASQGSSEASNTANTAGK